MNYFELYPGDYLRDTARLALIEHGAYLKLMLSYYSEETPLPASYAELYQIAVAISAEEKAAVRKVADKFFPVFPDGFRHKNRIDEEIEKAKKRIATARANGMKNKGTDKPSGNPAGMPAGDPEGTQRVTHSGEALHTPHEKKKSKKQDQKMTPYGVLFPEVDPKLLADFAVIRKAKKLPLTETAAAGIRHEAGLAGLSVEDAIRHCCINTWAGFKSAWYLNSKNNPTRAPHEPQRKLSVVERSELECNRQLERLDAGTEPVTGYLIPLDR